MDPVTAVRSLHDELRAAGLDRLRSIYVGTVLAKGIGLRGLTITEVIPAGRKAFSAVLADGRVLSLHFVITVAGLNRPEEVL